MIVSFLKRLYRFLKMRYAPRGATISFAGSGEDIIISHLFNKLKIEKVLYVDIGASHPVFGNNTYLFYKKGGRGVLIDPNEDICKVIKKKRPRDLCLNTGVGRLDGDGKFFSFPRSTRNTFSSKEAKAWEEISGQKSVIKEKRILSLDTVISKYLEYKIPDLVSIDTEGFEIEILSGFSWNYRPKIFCIEMVSSSGEENKVAHALMEKHGYKLAGKTPINSIYIDSK